MEILTQAAQFVLSLSILIVLHEMGHMLPAKWFKTRVEKFYLFFDAGFSLFKFKKGETEYGIGWIPLGGYVKISGMIDESMDKEQMKEPAKPWEFRSKPAWQRLIIMTGGVTVNLILGYLIYIMMLFVWGSDYLPNQNVKYGAHLSHEIFEEYGFQEGDLITSIDGERIEEFGDASKKIIIDGGRKVILLRNGNTTTIDLPETIVQDMLRLKVKGVFSEWRTPNIIAQIEPGKFAETAGLLKGDSIVGINDVSTPFYVDFKKEIQNHKSDTINIKFYRNSLINNLDVAVNEEGVIGYISKHTTELLDFTHKDYGFIESIPAGIVEGTATLTNYVKSIGLIFSKEGAKQIGGFGTIGSLYGKVWDWQRFWGMTALLSIILAFMNMLPIPALDGGHVMFLIYEIISGKPPSDKFLTKAQVVGMVILLSLLVYANGMDIFRWISGS
ncbi:MAG: RIP metalloprotease RseP [Flavobacteriales bacterium]|nr:RIP metalloprotease RseP [Flavobacteriales bacterium]